MILERLDRVVALPVQAQPFALFRSVNLKDKSILLLFFRGR
jgi:hypothetical protein